ncbi:aspartyl-phosphate phosphatase Spo0E family protein [Niallia endozanthoxylica]|uniref:Aspartyl-phosphate phosphatase Spo0E family protein n=1 Tax=Niallia endozanthoxylica TaxID=2036016 RepID=A0A5J5GS32_9BACI|nr:aspartyl-phosphate phosphatase Spo0E family protein [Niallia endozanthoxylica]KAA9011179.1 aspartyl-phosphate phosphatase Spo0E family protein [Niallia endozanthoxylica]
MESSQSLILTANQLLSHIEYLRKRLINLGLTYGFDHENTLIASQELDVYILAYQEMNSKLSLQTCS